MTTPLVNTRTLRTYSRLHGFDHAAPTDALVTLTEADERERRNTRRAYAAIAIGAYLFGVACGYFARPAVLDDITVWLLISAGVIASVFVVAAILYRIINGR